MAHSSRAREAAQPQIPDFYYDSLILSNHRSNEIVRLIINELISEGAEILHKKDILSRKIPFAARALSDELMMNVLWGRPVLDTNDITAEADDDLDLPPIDEWAGGVLPVRDAEATGLRTAVDPTPIMAAKNPSHHSSARRRINNNSKTTASSLNAAATTAGGAENVVEVKPPSNEQKTAVNQTRTRANLNSIAASNQQQKKNVKPPPTAADTILRTFEDVRKRANVTTKSVTVDADFTVIQITEPHGLPPSLIVPRVQTKKVAGNATNQKNDSLSIPRSARTPRTGIKAAIKRPDVNQAQTMLGAKKGGRAPAQRMTVEQDLPKFDNEISDITFSDRIVLSPGVTFKEGNAVKSRPPVNNTNQLTRAQYEQYLEEMMRTTEQS